MKARIFKMDDGTTVVSFPHKRYFDGTTKIDEATGEAVPLTMDDAKYPAITDNKPYIDLDVEALQALNPGFECLLYFDGDCTLENLKRDIDWQHWIMPGFMVRKKQIDYLKSTLTGESDLEKVKEVYSEIDRLRYLNDQENEKEIYEVALLALSRAEVDKSKIQEKLESKIAELNAK